jgi:hypothetical protein
MTALPIRVGGSQRGRALRLVATVVAFQGAWFACVLGAAHGWPWAGVALALLVIVGLIVCGDKPHVDALLIAVALAIGLAWDSALLRLGWIAYAAPGSLPGLAPAWILVLWALFAVTLREPMRALHRRLPLAAVLGAIGGPLSYLAAARLGACTLLRPDAALLALALAWAVITPLLLALARHLDTR